MLWHVALWVQSAQAYGAVDSNLTAGSYSRQLDVYPSKAHTCFEALGPARLAWPLIIRYYDNLIKNSHLCSHTLLLGLGQAIPVLLRSCFGGIELYRPMNDSQRLQQLDARCLDARSEIHRCVDGYKL